MAKKTAKSDPSFIVDDLKAMAVPCDTLILDPANARTHPVKNIDAIKTSLRVYGQRKPILVNRRNNIVEAGNGTLQAARDLGWQQIAVVWVDDDPVTAAGFSITDNVSASWAEWNDEALAGLINSMEVEDEELAKLMTDLAEERELDIDIKSDESGDDEETKTELIPEKWMVVIECTGEAQQVELLERFAGEGLTCKALIS